MQKQENNLKGQQFRLEPSPDLPFKYRLPFPFVAIIVGLSDYCNQRVIPTSDCHRFCVFQYDYDNKNEQFKVFNRQSLFALDIPEIIKDYCNLSL